MRVRLLSSHALALGFVFAVAGFCYAVSTNPGSATGSGVTARTVGTGLLLRFTNPAIIPGDYDLGDACLGSAITRYVSAEGGLRPYRFTTFGPQSLPFVILGTPSTLQLGLSGVLAGSTPGAISPVSRTITGSPGLRFQVNVQDSKSPNAESVTAFYNLTLVNSNSAFRFATPGQLPDGRLAGSYLSKIDVVGGAPTVTFTVLSVSGPGVTSQEQLGLFVTADGTVSGRPLAVGTFTYLIHAIDARGTIAKNRAQTANDQAFTVTVNPDNVTSNDLVTVSCSVSGSLLGNSKDSVKYLGVINVLGQDNFNLLNSDFSFSLGGLTVSGRLDKRGQFKSTLPDNTKVQVKVDAKSGKCNVSISNGNFVNLLNAKAFKDGALTRKPVQITVGQAIAESEVLDFDTRVSGTSYSLDYSLGNTGVNDAGAFQVVKVRGKDGATQGGAPGDIWQASFLAIPRNGIVDPSGKKPGLSGVTGGVVAIGANFVQNLNPASINSSGSKVSFKGDKTEGIRSLSVDTTSFKGTLATNGISSVASGIPLAINSPGFGNIFFSLGVTLNRGTTGLPFIGEHARRVFGLKKQWNDTPPKR